jgi:glycosyltransferase involved in cell wall biosynthesis
MNTYARAWPAYVPESIEFPAKDRFRGIYAGLLVPLKNTQEFAHVLPLVLQNTPTRKFVIIGLGSHVSIIKKLQDEFGDAIEYIPRLPRVEVLKLIGGSYFAYTPVKRGGWGFIGDCWGTKTPVLLSHNVYASEEVDATVAQDATELI